MTPHLADTPVIETKRLTLRAPSPEDVPAAIAFYVSERARYAGGHVPRFRAWTNATAILGHWSVRGYGLWTVTETGDDTALGFVGPYYPDGWPEREIGWVLFDGAEGRGIAEEAARATIADAGNRLNWTDMVSYIDPENTRSVALAERLGAQIDADAVVPKPDDPCLVYRHTVVSA